MEDAGFQAAARLVEDRSRRQLAYEPAFEALAPAEAGTVAAVDGSHAVLVDNGGTWVVATRTHIHLHGHPAPVQARPRIHAVLPQEADETLERVYGEAGLEAPAVRSADAFAEAMRSLEESFAWKEAIRMLPEGGLLLVDGALEQLPSHAQQAADRLLEARRGREVVGVAKRSALHVEGTPLVPGLAALGRERHPGAAWSTPVPRHAMAHVCLLHPAARHAFRVDTTSPDALGRLLPLCRDAVYTGYPYPLAKVHNLVAITQAETRRLKEQLDREVRKVGGARSVALLEDFHDILDRNVPR